MPGYKLSAAAKNDLQRIYNFGFREFGEEQADSYFHGFFACFEKITENPYLYQSVDHIRPGYRRCTYRSDSIYFKINDSTVEIMAILGGQNINEWL
ncbi:type II toxin-antitoxin system RelE/ParE family toxin [Microbulbifer sp. SH-1]|uniref:type II toxin-antitoxin system RelE/ParE family toxin n=1 Tax=Microbulbifer sp. SH-1 TaxID=2681547 RepID=UPI00140C40DE|nr:type II toxin-antitoxin system RelE/ParE family toxin [Microbulbifer sp. SH-1]QIL88451.1 type II toxin-antitoxin system RelE/ParE family toxin [Microbulbifer sp. SH-1]